METCAATAVRVIGWQRHWGKFLFWFKNGFNTLSRMAQPGKADSSARVPAGEHGQIAVKMGLSENELVVVTKLEETK